MNKETNKTILCKSKQKNKRFRIKEVYGDCLQAVGVKSNKSFAIIDRFITPKIGDIVHCAPPGVNISSYLKQVKDVKDGVYIVGTAYLDSSKDYTFEAGEIYGNENTLADYLKPETINKVAEYLYNAGYRKQSEWISVDEGLPESGTHSLIACTVKRIDGTHGQYVCVGYYAEKFKHLAYGVDDDCVSEYNEENDEYYIAEGWYEVIKNWDDYGFVAIYDFVTHWMPLPEVPKGGAE